MAELHHECGIAAVFQRTNSAHASDQPAQLVARMLTDLQHRGQQAAGLSVCQSNGLHTHKRLGSVRAALAGLPHLPGRAAIGHVRYATCGANELRFAQPFERFHADPRKWFTLAFNGQLANFADLRRAMPGRCAAECDTEILMHLIAQALDATAAPDLLCVFRDVSEQLDGAYNLVFLNAAGTMVALRDPTGIRPLCWATNSEHFAAASESWPLANLGFRDPQSLAPGELILIQDGRIRSEQVGATHRISHCFFEWIYFAHPESVLDEKNVADVRSALGRLLADHEREHCAIPRDTIVVPVPNTARHAAAAMALELGLPLVDGVVANDDVGRTFIDGSDREQCVRQKFTFRADLLTGRRVLLVEDTLIRSTTLQWIVAELRARGNVAEVHVRVACPPIIAPCYYGIDIATVDELFASKFTLRGELSPRYLEAMAREISADSLAYLPLDAIAQALGMPPALLCQACTTGRYPTPAGQRLYDLAVRDRSHANGHAARAPIAHRPRNR